MFLVRDVAVDYSLLELLAKVTVVRVSVFFFDGTEGLPEDHAVVEKEEEGAYDTGGCV